MINVDNLTYLLNDYIITDEFGTINFFTINDLLILKEKGYNKFIYPYRLSLELFGVENSSTEVKTFDLFFIRKKIKIIEGEEETILDYLINSLEYIYKTEKKKKIAQVVPIQDNDFRKCKIIIRNEPHNIILHRDNFDKFAEIILNSCYEEKFKIEKPPIFKNDRQKDIYYKIQEGRKRKNKGQEIDINTIISIVMSEYKKSKEDMRKMTLYELNTSFQSIIAKDTFNREYSKYLVGEDPKKLELTHWFIKIKNIFRRNT